MDRRTQLNINISPKLLEELKRTAIKSGKTLTSLVSEILTKQLEKNIANSSTDSNHFSIEERLNSLEKAVSLLRNKER